MTVGQQFTLLKNELGKISPPDEADAVSSLVMEHYTSIPYTQLGWNKDEELSPLIEQKVETALGELLNNKPVQYVLQEAWFLDTKYLVNEHVLIPRPETEELVDDCCKYMLSRLSQFPSHRILDIGTGSGCIPISIKKKIPRASVTSIDVSEEALMVAKANARSFDAEIEFRQMDFLQADNWASLGMYDVIISNPPYIPIAEKEKLPKNVTDWEPGLALFVPSDDPLLFYKKIAAFGKTNLTKNGMLFLECHQDFAVSTEEMLNAAGYKTLLQKDINGNYRMIKASVGVSQS